MGKNITFKKELGCGACINGGYIYCIADGERSELNSSAKPPPSVCCQNSTSCPEIDDTKYNCSISYTDKTYAKYVCPFKKDKCGV